MSFSGKKKKEQLKAKREKKREANEAEKRLEEKNHGEKVAESEEERDDLDFPKEMGIHGGSSPSESSFPRASHNTKNMNSTPEAGGELFKYGEDRHGIRSMFKKETPEELEARKKLNYAPLQTRYGTTSAGIPYEKWLIWPGFPAVGKEAVTAMGCRAFCFSSFPLSVELPSRGWSASRTEGNRKAGKGVNGDPRVDSDDAAEENVALMPLPAAPYGAPILSAEEIQNVERNTFAFYLSKLDALPVPSIAPAPLNVFERNVQVWQQLWRTVEASDVVLLVVDVRFPILHLPISLLRYIVVEQRKPCMVVLNKADLVPTDVLEKWLSFLPAYMKSLGLIQQKEEGENETGVYSIAGSSPSSIPSSATPSLDASVISNVSEPLPPIRFKPFTLNPEADCLKAASTANKDNATLLRRRKAPKKRGHLYAALRKGEVPPKLYASHQKTVTETDNGEEEEDEEDEGEIKKCHNIPQDGVYHSCEIFHGMQKAALSLHSDDTALREGLQTVSRILSTLLQECRILAHWDKKGTSLHSNVNHDPPSSTEEVEKKGTVLVGLVGHPNAGKSSLLNCIRGTKVVSVSATAGHTKHLQTIPIPDEGVTLLDSPGVVFPVFGIPRPLQAIIGTHQIAQTRDPQSCVGYLATHLPIEKLFGLRRPDGACDDEEWSPFDLCEAFAKKEGFFVKRGKGALDTHRASIAIIQEAFEGRLPFYFSPPNEEFLKSFEFLECIKPQLCSRVFS